MSMPSEPSPPSGRTAWSPADLPRERLWALGAGALTSGELIAILLGTGKAGEDAGAVARRLLDASSGSLRRLASRPPAELQRAPGGGPAKAARLLAALEIGQRLGRELRPPSARIRNPEDVLRHVGPRLRDLAVEEFHVLALDTQSRVLRDIAVTRGLLDSSLVHPREVFRAVIAEAAAGLILVHNHPSGDPTPSAEDRAVTRQLVAAGQLLDLPVYDHVIVAGDRFTSFATAGLL
jgi:DNA repair protein RadC